MELILHHANRLGQIGASFHQEYLPYDLADRSGPQELAILLFERHPLDGLEQLVRRHPCVSIGHLVDPADDAELIHQNRSWKREIRFSVLVGVSDVEPVDELFLLVGEEREFGA